MREIIGALSSKEVAGGERPTRQVHNKTRQQRQVEERETSATLTEITSKRRFPFTKLLMGKVPSGAVAQFRFKKIKKAERRGKKKKDGWMEGLVSTRKTCSLNKLSNHPLIIQVLRVIGEQESKTKRDKEREGNKCLFYETVQIRRRDRKASAVIFSRRIIPLWLAHPPLAFSRAF